MLTLLLICLVAGGIGALLQGMVGIGTGIIVIPLLTFILPYYGIPTDTAIHVALATSMAAIVVNSISALISHHKRGNVQWGLFKKIIGFSLVGSCLGALVASFMNGRYLEGIFGAFMLGTAIYMLLKKAPADTTDTLPDISKRALAIGGSSIGFFASIVGTGGGILMVPFLHSHHVKMRYAVGTSTLIGLPIAAVGASTYIAAGFSQMPHTGVTLGYLHWPAFLAISTAGLFGAPLGARLATVLPTKVLRRVFSVGMIFIGIKMLSSAV